MVASSHVGALLQAVSASGGLEEHILSNTERMGDAYSENEASHCHGLPRLQLRWLDAGARL